MGSPIAESGAVSWILQGYGLPAAQTKFGWQALWNLGTEEAGTLGKIERAQTRSSFILDLVGNTSKRGLGSGFGIIAICPGIISEVVPWVFGGGGRVGEGGQQASTHEPIMVSDLLLP